MTREQLASLARSKKALVAATAAFSSLAGAAAGFVYAQKKLQPMYEELALKEIEEAKQFYATLYKKDEYETPESAAEALGVEVPASAVEALKQYAGMASEVTTETMIVKEAEIVGMSLDSNGMGRVEVVKNVFTDAEVADEEDEEPLDTSVPFIISQEAFLENEPEHEQTTLTYFEGDDVLADQRDQAITETDKTIGTDTLKFGVKSNDPNVVYIRNYDLGLDIEILRSKGKFTEEVLGFIQHSEQRHKIRKFRGDYDYECST